MWIFMNDSFVSIVEDKTNPANLMVRARRKGDIERAFPGYRGRMLRQKTDYAYRATIPRKVVADQIAGAVRAINYTNFKDSVPLRDNDRHAAYLRVWTVMHGFQRRRAGDHFIGALDKFDFTRPYP